MAKYNSVAVILGSDTSESEVSCRSGEFVASRLDDTRFDVYEIYARFGKWSLVAMRHRNSMRVTFAEGSQPEVDKTDFSVKVLGEKVKFDFAYIVQHGFPGETGHMQGYLEMLGVPHSTCSAFVSAVAFDKHACKKYLGETDFVHMAPHVFVREGDDPDKAAEKAVARLAFPVFVKPTGAGSSFGVSRVEFPEALPEAIRFAFTEGKTVIVEQGISGRELTCAAYRDGETVHTLPLIEIISQNDYFDYDAKYNGHSDEVCPAPVSSEVEQKVKDATQRIYAKLGCKGVVRMDYILDSDGALWFLEVNTVPGMTSASLVPKMVRTAGIGVTDFLSTIIDNA